MSKRLADIENTRVVTGDDLTWLIARIKKLTEALEQIKKNKWVDGNLEITGSEYTLIAIASDALEEE